VQTPRARAAGTVIEIVFEMTSNNTQCVHSNYKFIRAHALKNSVNRTLEGRHFDTLGAAHAKSAWGWGSVINVVSIDEYGY
jgi:hypothetical protein